MAVKLDPRRLRYVPTLALRASELRGLEKLPGPTKDRLCPLFLLAPWPNAHQLSHGVAKIEASLGDRPFILDLDRDFEPGSDNPAKGQFADLFNMDGNFANWRDFVAELPHATPVLQLAGQTQAEVREQIESFQLVDKAVCLRVERARMPANLSEAVAAVADVGTSDFVVVLEAGWSQDLLSQASWFDGMVRNVLKSLDADIPIVLSGTTIPSGFSQFEGVQKVLFDNRLVVSAVAKEFNRRTFVYGDWGSTRPRTYDGGSRPLPRIDYPTKDSWLFSRSKAEGWSFETAAKHLRSDKDWIANSGLGVWGEKMINDTADGLPGIDSPQKNIASRVNIHLHRQAFYDTATPSIEELDEPWADF
jgi:hypothetical protein